MSQPYQRDNQGRYAHVADYFLARQLPEGGQQRFEDVCPIYGERGGLVERQATCTVGEST